MSCDMDIIALSSRSVLSPIHLCWYTLYWKCSVSVFSLLFLTVFCFVFNISNKNLGFTIKTLLSYLNTFFLLHSVITQRHLSDTPDQAWVTQASTGWVSKGFTQSGTFHCLASFVLISKECSLSQVPLSLRVRALGWGPHSTKSPGIPAVCL